MRHLKKSVFILATAGAVAATALPAYAGAAFSGFVATATGSVSGSPGFSGSRTAAGKYTITAPQSMFSTFPVMTVTPFGINGAYTTGILASAVCANGTCTWDVWLVTVPKGILHNNAFAFTVVEE